MKVFKRLIGTLKGWANKTINFRRVSPFGVLNVPDVVAEQATSIKPEREFCFPVNEGGVPAFDVVEAPSVVPVALSGDQWHPGVEVSMSTTDTTTTTTTTEELVPVPMKVAAQTIGLDLVAANGSKVHEPIVISNHYEFVADPAPVQHSIEVFVDASPKVRSRAKKAEATPAAEVPVPLKAKRKRSPRNKAKKNQSGETK